MIASASATKHAPTEASPALLRDAFEDPGVVLRDPGFKQAALRVFTAPTELEEFALALLAMERAAPEWLLRMAVRSPRGSVVQAAILNEAATPEVLEYAYEVMAVEPEPPRNGLLRKRTATVDEAHARKLSLQRLPAERAMVHLTHPFPELLTYAASRVEVPFEQALRLVEGGPRPIPEESFIALVGRPDAPEGFLLAAVHRVTSPAVLAAVAASPAVTTPVLTALYDSRPRDVRLAATIAANPSAPPEMLSELAALDNLRVKRALAGNPAAPRVTRQALLNDLDAGVRLAVAASPAMRWQELPDRDEHILGYILTPNTSRTRSVEALEYVFEPRQLARLAADPRLRPDAHRVLSEHPEEIVRLAALSSPHAAPERLRELLLERKLREARPALQNAATPLQALAAAGLRAADKRVQGRAWQRLGERLRAPHPLEGK